MLLNLDFYPLYKKYPSFFETINDRKIPLLYRYTLENDYHKIEQFLQQFSQLAKPAEVDYLLNEGVEEIPYDPTIPETYGVLRLAIDYRLVDIAWSMIQYLSSEAELLIFNHLDPQDIINNNILAEYIFRQLEIKPKFKPQTDSIIETWFILLDRVDKHIKNHNFFRSDRVDWLFPGDPSKEIRLEYGHLIIKYFYQMNYAFCDINKQVAIFQQLEIDVILDYFNYFFNPDSLLSLSLSIISQETMKFSSNRSVV